MQEDLPLVGMTNNKSVIWITESGTYWYPSVILLSKAVGMDRSTVFRALAKDGKIPTSPPSYVDYAAKNYDVEDEAEV